jgi:RNA polymerase sigma-70 factor (ECF subfamily)
MQTRKPIIDENTLVLRLQNADPRAFDYLYSHYKVALLGAIRVMVKDPAASEDILQDTFIKIWHNISKYDTSKGRLFTWLLRIASNTAKDCLRQQTRRRTQPWQDLEDRQDQLPQLHTEQSFAAFDIAALMPQLLAPRRQALELVYLRGYSHAEAAEYLRIPLGTLKSHVRAGLQSMRTTNNPKPFTTITVRHQAKVIPINTPIKFVA